MDETTTPQGEDGHAVSPELEQELQERAKTPPEQHLPWGPIKEELGL